jgi:hypothetical protein
MGSSAVVRLRARPPVILGNVAMPAKPTLYDLADYFQKQADRTRNEDRKAR